jgi:hypothetical protein
MNTPGAKNVPGITIAPGERPLMLIAHGYGGLVALKTLILNQAVKERCIGVLCLGTPFRPVDVDNNIISTLPIMPNESSSPEDLLDELEVLPELLAEWRALPGNNSVPIRCFYETDKSRDRNGIVRFTVPKQSAVLDDLNVMSFALDDVDHQTMNKFSGSDDPNYELMVDVLQGLVSNAYPAMLIQAIRNRNLEYAKQIVEQHRSTFSTNEALNPVLIEAVESGESEILQIMLNANVRVNTVVDSDEQETLLFLAVRSSSSRKLDIVRRLLEKGADVAVLNKDSKSPLMLAEELHDDVLAHLLANRPLILGPVARRRTDDWIDVPHKHVNDYGCLRKIYARIADVYDFNGEERTYLQNPSINDLIYERGPRYIMNRERARDGEQAIGGYRKFRWIHLPANNLTWMKDIIQRSYRERSPDENLSREYYVRNYQTVVDSSRWSDLVLTSPLEELSYIRSMLPGCHTLPYIGYPDDEPAANFIMFMPYLHYEYTSKRQQMAETIGQVRDRMRSIPPRGNIPDQNAFWAYLKKDNPLHIRRTLDQFYYDALDSDKSFRTGVPPRNDDQVTQRFMRSQPRWKDDDPMLLMVDQLWIAVLEDDTIITSFPQRWGLASVHDQNPFRDADIASIITKELSNQDRDPLDTPYDMMMLVIDLCTSVLFNQASHRNEKLRFFEFFERKVQQVV